MPRINSMDVTIAGCTRSFKFDPPASVDSDDPGDASLELLRDAETTEVELSNESIFEVSVSLTRTQRVRKTVTVRAEDEDAAREYVEMLDFDDLWDDYDAETEDSETEVEDVSDTGDNPEEAGYDYEA